LEGGHGPEGAVCKAALVPQSKPCATQKNQCKCLIYLKKIKMYRKFAGAVKRIFSALHHAFHCRNGIENEKW
jgi:hypothetical protein